MNRALTRATLLSLAVATLSLAPAAYGVTVSPAGAPPRPQVSSLSSAQFFVLLPDGRLEIADLWSRRVFRWDGYRWIETESFLPPRPDSP
jgi:hypothetical protein